MKAGINVNGMFSLQAENQLEAYALRQWSEANGASACETFNYHCKSAGPCHPKPTSTALKTSPMTPTHKLIEVRATIAEHRALHDAAAAEGITASEFIRRALAAQGVEFKLKNNYQNALTGFTEMTPEPIKYCKACDHFRGSWVGIEFAKCQRPASRDDLTGDQLISPRLANRHTIDKYCGVERKDYLDTCGKSAKYFKPRRPWWKFVLR